MGACNGEGGPLEVTSLVGYQIQRSRVQIQPGAKNFFLFPFPKVFFSQGQSTGRKGFCGTVVLFHRASVNGRKKMVSLEDAQNIYIYIFSLCCAVFCYLGAIPSR